MYQYFNLFYCWVVFHCLNMTPFVYPFLGYWYLYFVSKFFKNRNIYAEKWTNLSIQFNDFSQSKHTNETVTQSRPTLLPSPKLHFGFLLRHYCTSFCIHWSEFYNHGLALSAFAFFGPVIFHPTLHKIQPCYCL